MSVLRGGLSVGLLLALSGCATIYHDFVYEPHELLAAEPTGFKIAILPFEDRRETFETGSKAWSYLPLVPWATERWDERQDQSERYSSEYYFPELIPYTVAAELVENDISERVDIAPPALEDYDLIIHGVLHSTEWMDRRISYGLGFMSWITNLIALPQGMQGVTLDVTYAVYDFRGERMGQRRITQVWDPFYWGGAKQPQMQGVVETTLDANEIFVNGLVAMMGDPPLTPRAQNIDRRIRLYHSRLDPELPKLVKERDIARDKGGLYLKYSQEVQREILARAKYLEKYRRAEELVIAKQQEFIYNAQHTRLTQIAQVRAARREAEAQQRRAEQAYNASVMQSLAGAVSAGLLPAMGNINAAGGKLTPQATSQLAQDLGAAFAAMPAPPPPPPDMSNAISKIDIDATGLASPTGMLAGLKGNNLAEIREEFLKRYSKRTRTLSQIRRDFKASQTR